MGEASEGGLWSSRTSSSVLEGTSTAVSSLAGGNRGPGRSMPVPPSVLTVTLRLREFENVRRRPARLLLSVWDEEDSGEWLYGSSAIEANGVLVCACVGSGSVGVDSVGGRELGWGGGTGAELALRPRLRGAVSRHRRTRVCDCWRCRLQDSRRFSSAW